MSSHLLKEVFPEAFFAEPASEELIARVERELALKIPEPLRQLYLQCDGFRENRGNAKYLFALREVDFIGSLLSVSCSMWSEFADVVDLRGYVFFGSSSGDETCGISVSAPHEVISYHYSMESEVERHGLDIIAVWKEDFERYDETAL